MERRLYNFDSAYLKKVYSKNFLEINIEIWQTTEQVKWIFKIKFLILENSK